MGCGCSKADGSELNDAGDENNKINHTPSALSSGHEVGGAENDNGNENVKRSPSKLQKRNRPKTPRRSDVGSRGGNNNNSIDEKRSLEHQANATGLGVETSGALGGWQDKGAGGGDGLDEIEKADRSEPITTGTGTGIEHQPAATGPTTILESKQAHPSTTTGSDHISGPDTTVNVATTPPPPSSGAEGTTDVTTPHPSTPAAIVSDDSTTPSTASHRLLTPSTPTPRANPQTITTRTEPETVTPTGSSHFPDDETPTLTPKASTSALRAEAMSTPTPTPAIALAGAGAATVAAAAAATTVASNPWSSSTMPPPPLPPSSGAGEIGGESSRGLLSAHAATTMTPTARSTDGSVTPDGFIPGAFPAGGGLITSDRRPSDQRSMSSESVYYSVRSFVE